MLQIKNISKKYKTGDLVQQALDNVSLNLRDNEFVAILGPSGSGKTTLLNIIGGLDRYDSGDLIINNVSTKKYKDRDWDTYRNHTIGFVFQSYNLIPHQTVLSNVELALTIGGISRKERRQRALKALDEVGLLDQAHKKPNQMSGGQMQRVAIARALVNNPDILLADEPTGALDTKTSVQVMDLLKEVAKDRLVVMVTHNPDLANEYANRIIRLQDGVVISDTNSFVVAETKLKKKTTRSKKAHMSIFTALSLSFNNLLTKKGRTILTAFAGSIGIIGIALILSLSQGFQNYIDKIQEDTLSSYPLTITSDTADMTSAILSMVTDRRENKTEGENVIERQYLTTMFSSIGTNDLKSFKKYLESNEEDYSKDVSQIKYSYSVTPNIYTIDAAKNLVKLYPSSMWNMLYSNSASSFMSSFSSASGGMIFSEIPEDLESVKDQYDVLKGRWPERYDEMIIVLSEPNSISDLLVYSLGLRDTAELKTIISSIMSQDEIEVKNDPRVYSYDFLMGLDLRLVMPTDTYKFNSKYEVFEDMTKDDEYMREVYDNSLKLKIVGIVCAIDPDSTLALSPGVNFRSDLTQHVIDTAKQTVIVQKQLANKDLDVFSGKSFDQANEESKKDSDLNFEDMISVDEDMIKDAFKINVTEEKITGLVDADAIAKESLKVGKDLKSSATENLNTVMAIYSLAAQKTGEFIKQYYPMLFPNAKIAVSTTCMALDDGNPTEVPPEEPTFGLNGCPIVEGYEDYYTGKFSAAGFPINVYKDKYNEYYYPRGLKSGYSKPIDMIISQIKPQLVSDETFFLDPDSIEKLINDIVDIYVEKAANLSYATSADPLNTIKVLPLDKIQDQQHMEAIDQAITEALALNANLMLNDSAKLSSSILAGKAIGNALGETLGSLKDLFGEDTFNVDTEKFAQAFKFDLSEDELSRLMETMLSGTEEKSYKSNLISLGYQDFDDPTSISFYFKDFEAKENFINFLKDYNEKAEDEDKEIRYTDITGILMSSVKTIVDSVTYVLIAFVSISLVVSSIMIAVITLISVMERTKEIGILRAMGASKHNVSSIFNAETFIIGLLSGLLGVGVTFAAIPPINSLIHNVTGNYDINAVLPTKYAIILVFISVFLTIIAGIIPSRKASKQDPVIALRTE